MVGSQESKQTNPPPTNELRPLCTWGVHERKRRYQRQLPCDALVEELKVLHTYQTKKGSPDELEVLTKEMHSELRFFQRYKHFLADDSPLPNKELVVLRPWRNAFSSFFTTPELVIGIAIIPGISGGVGWWLAQSWKGGVLGYLGARILTTLPSQTQQRNQHCRTLPVMQVSASGPTVLSEKSCT
eukprot:TRINITY_DN66791_c7_g1_i1.p1 TRINITY_DN66791_c7_g1~~TRINITY_DN66791_c7_g1_i1.p1  ORF type:complete len:185 (-),score=23.53 TRINITY_DN66791_c7_g1_i1:134-688(-)